MNPFKTTNETEFHDYYHLAESLSTLSKWIELAADCKPNQRTLELYSQWIEELANDCALMASFEDHLEMQEQSASEASANTREAFRAPVSEANA